MITVKDMMNWLDNHDVNYEEEGVQEIYDAWLEAKSEIIEKFRKHPNWDENAMAIVLREESYDRGFNQKAIIKFYNWTNSEINKILKNFDCTDTVKDIKRNLDRIDNMIGAYYSVWNNIFTNIKINPLINGAPMIHVLKDKREELNDESNKYIEINEYNVEKHLGEKYKKVQDALSVFFNATDFLATQEQADRVNEILDIKAVKGQKISKIIRKICCTVGIDKITDVRDMGSYTKDMGFNREYAMLTDEINPFTFKKITVISVNPLDYWSMSHGRKWVSCHYVGDNDDGCYSSGTESYMLDDVSIIYYIIDKDYEGNEYYSQPKERRCVFCIQPDGDMILESRVYPDGRDGGDQTLAGQFRNVMQKIVSDCWDKNNYWSLKKGRQNCKDLTITNGTHYPDYTYYDDCNVSINKDMTEPRKIRIGHDPICPVCGQYHSTEENIVCNDCNDIHGCYNCGISVDRDDYIYCEDNDRYYCCESCAESDDVHYCEDDGMYHDEDNCFFDNYKEAWYSGEPEVIAEDDTKYASYDNAFNADYDRDDDGNWYPISELIYCEKEGISVHENSDYVHAEDGEYFSCESEANNYDYYEDIEGNWYHIDKLTYCEDEDVYVLIEDAITTSDDNSYSSEDKAIEYGYHEVDGEWIKEVA